MTPDELVIAHLPLAHSMASRFSKKAELEDLKQEAVMGLVRASRKYDSSRGFLFSTFARWEVLHSIQDYIRKNQPYLGSGDTQENEDEDTHFVADKADPSPGPEEIYLARESEAVRRQLLRFCENDRERMILERRWLAEGEVPLWQIGEIFGVSFERVRQIESRLFRRIRQGLTLKS